jgi:hypothetical protein
MTRYDALSTLICSCGAMRVSVAIIFTPGGFAPPDPPTRSLARRFAGALRSRDSLAAARSLPIMMPCRR